MSITEREPQALYLVRAAPALRALRGVPAALSLFVMALVLLVASACGQRFTPPEPTLSPMTYTQQIDRTLTIGDVTVELEEIKRSPDTLAAKYSYQVSDPNLEVDQMINGFDLIRADGSIEDLQRASRTDDGSEIVNFDLSTRIPELGENVGISLGSYIVAAPEISGSVMIPLSSEYATALSKESETNGPVRIPLRAEMSIGDKRYNVAEMLVFPQKFRLWVYPSNEAARSTELGVIAPAAIATLTDNTGASYRYVGGDTAFDDLSPRGHKWRQFIFLGRVLPSVASLTFNVKGGADIVGPFVFDNIALVSEDIPPVTPVPPGGVGPGDPIPTPPNVNN